MRPAGMVHSFAPISISFQARAERLAGARGGQDEEFERAGANAVLLSQRSQEGADAGIR